MTFMVTSMLKRSAQQYPNNVFTVDATSGRQSTYAQSEQRVARMANALRENGLSDGGIVAVLMMNSDRYLETFFTCAWAGGICLPVNIRLAPPEMIEQFNDAKIEFIMVDDTFAAMLPAFKGKIPTLKKVIFAGNKATPAGCLSYEDMIRNTKPCQDAGRSGDDTFGIYYTGGTTGRAKGVQLTHTNIWINAIGHVAQLHYGADSRYLHSAPMFHLADAASSFGITIAAGSHVFIEKFDPVDMLKAVQTYKCNKLMMVPVMIAMLLQAKEKVAGFDGSSVQSIIYGASPMPPALLKPAISLFPHADWKQGYGQTESSPAISMLGAAEHRAENPTKLGSVGRPVPWVEVKIVDENDQEVPRGTVGEVITRGPHVMKGYLNMPEKTAETLRGGWLHTEDAGYMDQDGYIFLVDRLKDMIITGGENVYSSEVEKAVQAYPGVALVAVIGLPDPKYGEIVTAVVQPEAGKKLDGDAIIKHCRDLIAGYKVPRKVVFRDALPVSGPGKILKNELRKELKGNTSKL